jgi:hypothetical protein
MIRPLRAAHMGIFVGLAILLPVLLIAGLLVRTPEPVSASTESPLVGKHMDIAGQDYRFRFTVTGSQIQFTTGTFALHPDVLAYTSSDAASFPNNSELIGPPRVGTPVAVPASDTRRSSRPRISGVHDERRIRGDQLESAEAAL